MNAFLEWAYLALMTFASFYLPRRNDSSQPLLSFVVIMFIWASALPMRDLLIFPVTAGLDIQPKRFVLLFFSITIIAQYINRNGVSLLDTAHEKFLVLFYIACLVVIDHHVGATMSFREAVVIYAGYLTFPVLYYALKHNADKGMILSVVQVFIILGVLSAVVSAIQFFVEPGFLRYTFDRLAFGARLRSNGLFAQEYTASYFCIMASYMAILFLKNRLTKIAVMIALAVGVALSFHRMSYFVYLATVGFSICFVSVRKERVSRFVMAGLAVVAIISLVFISGFLINAEFMKERILADTLSVRVDFYTAALKRISQEWAFGVGSVNTMEYYYDAIVADHEYVVSGEGEAGGIHNLFLYLAYFFGVPAALCFAAFLFTHLDFSWKSMFRRHLFHLLPAMTMSLFIMANFLNYFPPDEDVSLFVSIVLGVSMAALNRDIEDEIRMPSTP